MLGGIQKKNQRKTNSNKQRVIKQEVMLMELATKGQLQSPFFPSKNVEKKGCYTETP